MKKPTISFTVEPEQYENIKEYARLTYHGTVSSLARFALGKYMARYGIKRQGLKPCTGESNIKGDRS